MEIADFIKKLEAEIDTIPQGTLTPETNYRELKDWSSMHALIIIALADTEYGVTLGGNDLRAASTVSDLFNIIKSKVA